MSITANIADNVVRLAYNPIEKTIQVKYVERNITKQTMAAEMKYYAIPGTELYKNIPIQAFRQASKDPLGTVGKFLPDGHRLNAATIAYFRLRWVMFKRVIAANGELSGDDLTIALTDFPLVDQAFMSSPTPYEPPEEVDATKPIRTRGRRGRRSRKRRRSPSEVDSSDSDASSGPDAPRNSRQIIPLVTDVTDVAAVEGAVVQYTPSYIAEAIPKAVLCGTRRTRTRRR